MLQTFVALLAVIALAYFVLRSGRKLSDGNHHLVTIVEKTTLSNQSYLAVMKVGANYHLISVTSGNISILKDMDTEEVEQILEEKKRKLEEHPIHKLMQIEHPIHRLMQLENPMNKLKQMRKNRE
ncbi:MAG: flagellar biosynthetic protein FliO [Clostridiaceae bacterium]